MRVRFARNARVYDDFGCVYIYIYASDRLKKKPPSI